MSVPIQLNITKKLTEIESHPLSQISHLSSKVNPLLLFR